MKNNREFRKEAAMNAYMGIVWCGILLARVINDKPTIKGTYFSSIKQTRIINKLKLLR